MLLTTNESRGKPYDYVLNCGVREAIRKAEPLTESVMRHQCHKACCIYCGHQRIRRIKDKIIHSFKFLRGFWGSLIITFPNLPVHSESMPPLIHYAASINTNLPLALQSLLRSKSISAGVYVTHINFLKDRHDLFHYHAHVLMQYSRTDENVSGKQFDIVKQIERQFKATKKEYRPQVTWHDKYLNVLPTKMLEYFSHPFVSFADGDNAKVISDSQDPNGAIANLHNRVLSQLAKGRYTRYALAGVHGLLKIQRYRKFQRRLNKLVRKHGLKAGKRRALKSWPTLMGVGLHRVCSDSDCGEAPLARYERGKQNRPARWQCKVCGVTTIDGFRNKPTKRGFPLGHSDSKDRLRVVRSAKNNRGVMAISKALKMSPRRVRKFLDMKK